MVVAVFSVNGKWGFLGSKLWADSWINEIKFANLIRDYSLDGFRVCVWYETSKFSAFVLHNEFCPNKRPESWNSEVTEHYWDN